jgi:hypothetical protein
MGAKPKPPYTMKIFIISAAFAVISAASFAQTKPTYVDGVKVTQQEADKLKMEDITAMQVDKDGNHITTRMATCNAYWAYFKSKSPQYARLIPTINELYKVQYIINGTVLTTNFDNTLAGVNDNNLISIAIVDNATLSKNYNVTDKPYGVIIKTHPTAAK